MGIGCFLTIIVTFIQTPRHNIGTFIGGRAIIGIGQGIALTAGPIYIGELAPPEIRGKVMSFWQLFYSVRSFLAYWINYACQLNVEKLGEWTGRLSTFSRSWSLSISSFFFRLFPRPHVGTSSTATGSTMPVRYSAVSERLNKELKMKSS
ncbi:hypothetical protein VC83_01119 [Pseudogymnoascus destructans]|uniref:Major facilitator superfamily (MFS) profile domain-containing protein n=1 Tax=Pseudogymnoascus destructans TaxID=655981 RepID=A0A177AKK5_9PEZI|nr:uncharacterized protein VC83_01119 [Pseudogymnoascus destructans]OAF62330.1 hypothetical protein VC83_01119 [Pseudogymnoascus destructans]